MIGDRAGRLVDREIARLEETDGPPHDTVFCVAEGGIIAVICECLEVLVVVGPGGGREVIEAYLEHRRVWAER
jgi:hypothetical protein